MFEGHVYQCLGDSRASRDPTIFGIVFGLVSILVSNLGFDVLKIWGGMEGPRFLVPYEIAHQPFRFLTSVDI